MAATITPMTANQVANALDALSAVSIDLYCYCDVAPDTLLVSAGKTREACEAIKEGIEALKAIVEHLESRAGAKARTAADTSESPIASLLRSHQPRPARR